MRAALELLEAHHDAILIVLLDIIMPVMDGFEMLQNMAHRTWKEEIPVVLITSENSDNALLKGYELGVSDIINKPFNPNIVKVVCKANGEAMYFSRAPIPYARDHFAQDPARKTLPAGMAAFRHVGLYAYRARFLRAYSQLPPSPLESIEALEQLRAMWNGFRIGVVVSDHLPVPGVDTPEDAKRMQDVFARSQ